MAKKMKKEKPHCGICKSIQYGKMNQTTGQEEDSICKLFNHVLSRKDILDVVDCNSFERKPFTCASCGTDIVGGTKASNPLRYRSGKHKGEVKPCCDNPDWRFCPNKECDGDDAIVCRNCGWYYGDVNW